MEITNRLLFFKYAFPCADTLVKRGMISKVELDKMFELVKKGKEPDKNSEQIFKVALAHLTLIAKKNNKEKIDDDTIREYFLFNHDKVVDERFEEMKDFDPEACKTDFGIVTKLKSNNVLVETDGGIKSFRNDYAQDLNVDDIVVVHRNFVVEKISEKLADKLGESMEKYVKDMEND